MKTNKLLLLGGALFLGYQLAPQAVKDQLPFSGTTGGSGGTQTITLPDIKMPVIPTIPDFPVFTENPFDWQILSDMLSKTFSEMPTPDFPNWLAKPDWIDKLKDVTLPKTPTDLIPDWFIPDALKTPDLTGMLQDVLDMVDLKISAIPTPAKRQTSGGDSWFTHLQGGWQDVYDFPTPFDIGKYFYGTDAYKAENLLTEYAKNVKPRPERSAPLGEVAAITEASVVRAQAPYSSSGGGGGYRPVSPIANPKIRGTEIVGLINGSPVSRLVRDKPKPPPSKAKWWMYT